MPPETADEIAGKERLANDLRRLAAVVQQRNLDNAVLLAKMAAAGRGPLVEHFAEIGRRFAGVLSESGPKPKDAPRLKVILGGR